MSLISDLEKVIKKVKIDSENWSYEDFPEPWEIGDTLTLRTYVKGTALEKFEKDMKKILNATSYEYKLELVSVVAFGDINYEFTYVLVWYDTKLNFKKITYGIYS